MSKKKYGIEFFYKLLIIIVSAVGIVINYRIDYQLHDFLYFTTLSNIFVFVFYLINTIKYIIKPQNKTTTYYIIKGFVTMAITITFFVYNFIIAKSNMYDGYFWESMFVHVITPVMVILDYIIFGEKGNLKKKYTLYWSIPLVIYNIFCWIYSFLGGTWANGDKYPYFYMNIEEYGIVKVAISCLLMLAVYILYGLLITWLDNLVGKQKKTGGKK